MQKKRMPEKAHNALVLVDAGPLSRLTHAVPREFVSDSRRYRPNRPTLIDGLKLLAEHGGMDVKIPAMVCWEGAGVSPCGFDPRQLAKSLQPGYTPENDWYVEHTRMPRKFLNDVLAFNCPNIDIAMPTHYDTSASAKFIRYLSDMEDKYFDKDMTRPGKTERLIRDLAGLRQFHTNQYGDEAMERIVRQLPKDFEKPVIVLTDDSQLAPKLRKAHPRLTIIAVSSRAYLRAMHESDLLKHTAINFPDARMGDESLVEIDTKRRAAFPRDKAFELKDFDTSIDYDNMSGDYPFAHMLRELKPCIEASIEAKKEAERLSPPDGIVLTRAQAEALERRESERLGQRWGKFSDQKRQLASVGDKKSSPARPERVRRERQQWITPGEGDLYERLFGKKRCRDSGDETPEGGSGNGFGGR
ncbi:MAG: hypothetical protein EBV03_08860 [Proteobacteria bacterium]|nr:hypothetical protein [Pseudomonadota bacterium]